MSSSREDLFVLCVYDVWIFINLTDAEGTTVPGIGLNKTGKIGQDMGLCAIVLAICKLFLWDSAMIPNVTCEGLQLSNRI